MAVFNPDQTSLAPSYANIIAALRSQTEQAQNAPPSTMGMLAGVAGKAAGAYVGTKVANSLEASQQDKLMRMKANIQYDLDKKGADLKAQGEGKTLVTPEIAAKYYQDMGIDPKYLPNIPKEGVYFPADYLPKKAKYVEFQTKVSDAAKEYGSSDSVEDKKLSKLLDVISSLPEDEIDKASALLGSALLPKDKTKGQLRPGKDDSSSTGYSYFSINADGDSVNTGIESPEPSMSRGAASLSPVKRQEALRAEFAKKAKEINYRKFADAYTVASSAKEKKEPTPASDTSLLYNWARMNNPVGVLSDQDFRTSVNIGSLGDDVKKALNKLDKGQVLSDDLRNGIIAEIESKYSQADANLAQIEDEHKLIAESEGLDYTKTISPVRPAKLKSDDKPIIKTVIQDGKTFKIEVDKNGKFVREVK
jgi:hypothetical protein